MLYGVAKVVMMENHQQNGLSSVNRRLEGKCWSLWGWFLPKAVKKDVLCLEVSSLFSVTIQTYELINL